MKHIFRHGVGLIEFVKKNQLQRQHKGKWINKSGYSPRCVKAPVLRTSSWWPVVLIGSISTENAFLTRVPLKVVVDSCYIGIDIALL